MKQSETISGYLYYIFPCEYSFKTKEIEVTNHWFNKYFGWILIYIINPLLDICSYLTGEEYWFFVKFYGANQEKLKEMYHKNST